MARRKYSLASLPFVLQFRACVRRRVRQTKIITAGSVLRTFSTPGKPVAFADDGRRFLIETDSDFLALDIEGNTLWRIPSLGSFGARVRRQSRMVFGALRYAIVGAVYDRASFLESATLVLDSRMTAPATLI